MTANADTYSSASSAAPNLANEWCPPQPGNIVRLPVQNIATLQGYINGLSAVGATSINAGMKWGLGLLDPGSRDIYTNLINGGAMDANLAGRPFNYDDNEALKVIVLMTDGEHFAEERVNDPYKSGLSPIYKSAVDGNYSIFHASAALPNQYYVPFRGAWQALPWTNAGNTGTATLQTWVQVWASMRLQYVAWDFYGVPLGGASSTLRNSIYSSTMTAFKTLTPTTTMDTQLQTMCSMAKSNNVIVYGIAFEAPTNGQAQIRACTTDGDAGSHYFNASGLEIATAFSAIANNISQLRLTQ